MAAVGLTEAMITVLYAVAIGLGMGVTAMVSRRIGARPVAAAYVVGQAVWVGAVLAVLIGAVGVLFAANLLRMMGASEGVIEEGSGFTAVLIGGNASILYLFLLNAAFAGRATRRWRCVRWRWPTASTWCSTLLHFRPRRFRSWA